MNVRYRVELDQAERSELAALLCGGKHAARKLKRAQILLAADAGASDRRSRGASALAARPSTGAPLCARQSCGGTQLDMLVANTRDERPRSH